MIDDSIGHLEPVQPNDLLSTMALDGLRPEIVVTLSMLCSHNGHTEMFSKQCVMCLEPTRN
jgi:hypothetical protein